MSSNPRQVSLDLAENVRVLIKRFTRKVVLLRAGAQLPRIGVEEQSEQAVNPSSQHRHLKAGTRAHAHTAIVALGNCAIDRRKLQVRTF